MEYIIKGIKTFKGHDGEPCAQGNLYKDNKKVAEWSDDSWGGPIIIRFNNKEEENKFIPFAKEYLKTQKNYDDKPFDIQNMNDYSILENTITFMSYAAIEEKQMLKLCKNKIAFYAGKNENEKTLYTINLPYTKDNVEKLKTKRNDILEIINETLKQPFQQTINTTPLPTKNKPR